MIYTILGLMAGAFIGILLALKYGSAERYAIEDPFRYVFLEIDTAELCLGEDKVSCDSFEYLGEL